MAERSQVLQTFLLTQQIRRIYLRFVCRGTKGTIKLYNVVAWVLTEDVHMFNNRENIKTKTTFQLISRDQTRLLKDFGLIAIII